MLLMVMNLLMATAKTVTTSRFDVSRPLAETSMYAVCKASDGGFVVVTKEPDGTEPSILAYSPTPFDADSLPCGLQWWLSATDEALQVSATDTGSGSRQADRRALRQVVSRAAADIPDFLETAWGQDSPYNLCCPKINNYPSKTGCMATAMAQVMRYYHWPEHGTGQGGYYLGGWGSAYFHSEAVNGIYDWANMDYPYMANAPEEAQQAVALLMYDCGKACQTFYYAGASAAAENSQLSAMTDNFQYDRQTMRFCERDKYSPAQWLQMVYGELQARRPIFYSGYLPDELNGHAFLLCGMDEEGRVYVNWGQDGRYDGFFSIDALILAGIDLTHAQTMIIGVQPATSSTAKPETWSAGDEPAVSYTLDGRRTDSYQRGINIVRQGNKVVKVVR